MEAPKPTEVEEDLEDESEYSDEESDYEDEDYEDEVIFPIFSNLYAHLRDDFPILIGFVHGVVKFKMCGSKRLLYRIVSKSVIFLLIVDSRDKE